MPIANVSGARKSGGLLSFSIDIANFTKGMDRAIQRVVGNKLQVGMRNGLQEFSNLVAEEIRQGAPTHIKNKVEAGTVEVIGGHEFRIRIRIDEPSARAIEYGSGLRATRGTQKTYTIAPGKTSPNLQFYWKKKGRWFIGKNGQTVQHPGVPARPFVAPALRRVKGKFNQIMIRNIRSV